MPVAIPPFLALCGMVVALGIILGGKLFVSALFGVAKGIVNQTVGRIPWVGGKIAGAATGPIHAIEKRLVGYMEHMAVGLETAIAGTWHVLAETVAATGYAIAHTAHAVWHLGTYVHNVIRPAVINTALGRHNRAIKQLQANTKALDRYDTWLQKQMAHPATSTLGKGARTATKPVTDNLAHGIGSLGHRVAALEHAAEVVIPGTLDGLESATRTLQRGLDWTRAKVRRHERLLGAAAFAALVTHAMARLGAGWFRCTNVRHVGRRLCGMDPTQLESLLAGTLALVGTISIVEFAKELQLIVGEGESAIHGLIREK